MATRGLIGALLAGALLTVVGAFVTLGFAWAAGAGRFTVEG